MPTFTLCCPTRMPFCRKSGLPASFAVHRNTRHERVGMFMKRLLILISLAGAACAQTSSSAFSTDGRVPTAPEVQPTAPSMPSTRGDGNSGLPGLLPQPTGKPTLIGGTIFKIDRVRDQMTLNLFGGGRTRILFDARTHIYRDGVVASPGDLQNGTRVYVDTVLAGVDIFAQS